MIHEESNLNRAFVIFEMVENESGKELNVLY